MILADWASNQGNFRMQFFLILFRFAHVASVMRKRSKLNWFWSVPTLVLYRFISEWLFHMEVPPALEVGEGLIIDHGYILVINKHSKIGEGCRFRHNVTIGCKLNSDGSQGKSPMLGNGVDVGVGALIIGDIIIGDNVVIGAGAVVTKNVPDNSVVVGNPARILVRSLEP